MSMMRIAVLALQGAFAEHRQMLRRLGVDSFEVRQLADWSQPKDGLIIPGGESTVLRKLLLDLGLLEPVRQDIVRGLPVFGTCAGLILLARRVEGEFSSALGTMDIKAKRNAYGRQLGSFHAVSNMEAVGERVPMTFIRAPYIMEWGSEVSPLAIVDGHCVAARQGNQLVTAFHPELDDDERVHRYFVERMCQS